MPDDRDAGFKVTDKRKFNPDGSLRSQSSDEEQPERTLESEAAESSARVIEFPGETGRKKEKAVEPARPAPAPTEEWDPGVLRPHGMPEPSFENLVNMLAVEAVMHLGLIENPAEERSVDLAAARHMIDMLGMLDQKTRGNLSPDEAELMEGVLADLRMQFVAVSRSK
ncbi:MAG TPA: DUF1844 domain-containing protein [Blastocatellia bacterium]|nr:DUF1844 domain-containing protein [Blastocatellia bacterium]